MTESCVQAGWQPEAIDLFGDWDLQRCCPTRQVSDLGQSLSDCCVRKAPVLFGTGFERLVVSGSLVNLPRLTLNSSIRSVKLCRAPKVWSKLLRKAGHIVPELFPDSVDLSHGQSEWLVKPVVGSGGLGIRRLDIASRAQIMPAEFLQEFVEGNPASLVALADGQSARLLGSFHQIVGDTAFGAPGEFCFVGSVGPVSFGERIQQELEVIVNGVANGCGLRGIFGLDFVINRNRPVVVEINPRPTSSCELLEMASGTSLMPLHVQALTKSLSDLESADADAISGPACFGKSYVFWNRPIPATVTPLFHDWLIRQHSGRKAADIPMAHTMISPESPIATVLASGPNSESVLVSLRELAKELLDRLTNSQQKSPGGELPGESQVKF